LRELPPERRLAAIAATALAASLILPWYQKSVIPPNQRALVQESLTALAVFSFVEAAVLLVAVAVLFLLWTRIQGKAFHLPGGDGFVISLAGGWAMALLVWRLFDKPDVDGAGATVGIQWGIFGAMVAAGALIAAGARVRAAHRPEPPNPAEDLVWEAPGPTARRRDEDRREPRDATAVTEVLRKPPAWQGEPPAAPGRRPDPPPAPQPERRDRSEPPASPDRLF
jgi:hypothetical protein